jgi:molybdopterin-guanine dinucleotide biosynthesis protein A
VPGVLLTGGASRRLGADKAGARLDGRTLAAHAAAMLAGVCDPVVEVGPGHTDLVAVREDPPGRGPLAALVAGVTALGEAAWSGGAVLLACDLPLVAPVLERLAAASPGATALPLDGDGRPQYVCARYSAAALRLAGALEARGVVSMHALVDAVRRAGEPVVELAGLPAGAFADVDTPADAARLGVELPR